MVLKHKIENRSVFSLLGEQTVVLSSNSKGDSAGLSPNYPEQEEGREEESPLL